MPSAGMRHPWNTWFEWTTVKRDPQLLTRDEVARRTAAGFLVDRRRLVFQHLVIQYLVIRGGVLVA